MGGSNLRGFEYAGVGAKDKRTDDALGGNWIVYGGSELSFPIGLDEAGIKGIGYKNVTINEPFFQGHFPSNPIMPGVLQIEAMAQTAAFVIASQNETLKQANVLFMGVDKVKFRRQVVPGDMLKICVEKVNQHRNVYVCAAKTYVDEKLVCEAILTAMVR